jgi:hypothetical protein
VAIVQGTLSLNLNGASTSISNIYDTPSSGYVGFKTADNSTGYYSTVIPNGFSVIDASGNVIVALIKNALGDYGSLTLNSPGSSRSIRLDSQNQVIRIGGIFPTQVLTVQQAGPGTPSGWADSTAQTWASNLLTALRTHGLVT